MSASVLTERDEHATSSSRSSPISLLPDELLALILIHATSDVSLDPSSPEPLGWFLLSFTAVSRRWRAVALSTPQLWRTIWLPHLPLYSGDKLSSNWGRVGQAYHTPEFHLAHSGALPLNLSAPDPERADALFNLLASHPTRPKTRIASLYLGPRTLHRLAEAARAYTQHISFPSLSSLGISLAQSRASYLPLVLRLLPTLQSLEFELSPSTNTHNWDYYTFDRACSCGSGSGSPSGSGSGSGSDSAAPVRAGAESNAKGAIRRAHLPHLKELRFLRVLPVEIFSLLRTLHAPNLQHLTLIIKPPPSSRFLPPAESDIFTNEDASLFSPEGPAPLRGLKSLTIGGRLTPRDIFFLLLRAPGLEVLRVAEFSPAGKLEETLYSLLSLCSSPPPAPNSRAPEREKDGSRQAGSTLHAPLPTPHTLGFTGCKLSLPELLRLLDSRLGARVRRLELERHMRMAYDPCELEGLGELKGLEVGEWSWRGRYVFGREIGG